MTHDAAATALETLYTTPPGEFVRARKRLVMALKAEGHGAAAKQLAQQRKPTQAAYLLNQMARRHAEVLAQLLDTGRALERAQRQAMRGRHDGQTRGLLAAQRKALAGALRALQELARRLGVTVSSHELAGALHAGLADAAVGARLEAGMLHQAPQHTGSFAGLALGGSDAGDDEDAGDEEAAPSSRRRPTATGKKRQAAARKKAEAARAAEQRARRQREREHQRLQRALAAAERRAEGLQAKADRLLERVAVARAEVDAHRRALQALT